MSLQSLCFRLISSRAALALLVGLIFFGCAGRAAQACDACASSPVLEKKLAGSGFSQDPAPVLLALGGSGSRDREALATRNVKEASQTEQLFQGSFLGALLFGYPYTGLGKVDILVMGLLLFLFVRAIGARRRGPGRQDDRFSVDRQDSQGNRPQNRDLFDNPEEKQRTRVEDLRPPADPGKQPDKRNGNQNGSRENAWSRKLGGSQSSQGSQPSQGARGRRPQTVQENAAAMWGRFSSQEAPQNNRQAAPVAAGADIPAGFDVPEFLEGARALYVRLQQAWAARKVDELAPFISASMLQLLQKQAEADPDPVPVEILLVNAVLNKVSQDGQKAEVAFSVAMRTGREEEPAEVNETWLFARGGDFGKMWQLTGIKQA